MFNGRNSSNNAQNEKYISKKKYFFVSDAHVEKIAEKSIEFLALIKANERRFNGKETIVDIAPKTIPRYITMFWYLKKIACFKRVPKEERANVVKIGTMTPRSNEIKYICLLV